MTQTTLQTAEQVSLLPIGLIRPSANNPRKTSSQAALVELCESIASQGVLSPIVVRPCLPTDQDEGLIEWEVVFGHRRLAAADQAGLDTIPAIVRAMTDQEADLARLHENLEREDVHYIEEAEALQRLIDTHGLTVPQLMQQTGKPMVWVYGRLKLAKLHPAVREVCLAGTIGAEVAQLIGRVPQPLQPQAMDRCLETDYHTEGHPKRCRPFRWCRDELRRGFTISIEQAPFDTSDPTLPRSFGGHGSCYQCQSLSDNDAALAELGHGLCCNPSCYQARSQAARDAQLATLREQGRLRVGQAAQDLLNSRDHVSLSNFVEGPGGVTMTVAQLIEHAKEYGGPKVETSQIEVAVVPFRDPATAPIVERVPASVVAKLQAAFGVKPVAPPDEDAEEAAYQAMLEQRWDGVPAEHRAVLDAQRWNAVRQAIFKALPTTPGSTEDLRYIAINTLEVMGWIHDDVRAMLGWPEDLEQSDSERRRVLLLESTPDQLALMMLGTALSDDSTCGFNADDEGQAYKAHVRDRRLALAARHGVDVIAASGLDMHDAAHPQADLLDAIGHPTPGKPAGGVQSGETAGEAHEQGAGDAAAAADAQKIAAGTATTAKGKGKAKGKTRPAACGGQKVMDDAACGGNEAMDDDAQGVGQTSTEGAQT